MADGRLVPNGAYVSVLYRKYEHRPAIVIGGGPSTPEQLAALPPMPNAVVISANGHAFKLPGLRADYIVCKDHVHTETHRLMEPDLRVHGVPLVSRQYWADYRLGAWPTQGNSGMMAIGFAVILGCRPVIPLGFDCYQNGTYFHDLTSKNVSAGRFEGQWRSRYQRLAARMFGAAIRPPAGALFNTFPAYSPEEEYGKFHMPTTLQPYERAEWAHVRALKTLQCRHSRNTIPQGYVFPADGAELAQYGREGLIEKVDTPAGL